nr:unnamed protein product [Digitaria exilis]
MQAIPWERLEYSRDDYRGMRLKGYKNFESLSWSHDLLDSECKQVEKEGTFYDFCFNTRLAKSTVGHFQLRDLVWATSKHDVYTAQHSSVRHWSSLLQRGKEICTMAVRDKLMVAGGFRGELVCKYIDRRRVAYCANFPGNGDNTTNSVDVYETPSGSTRVMVANNDHIEIATLKGHLDHSFSSAWHPDGRVLATGNQDTTCRLWDIRNLSQSFAVLKGRIGAIRNLKFSSDGRFLAASEVADFVHVYDVHADYSKEQEIDIFGEIAGMSFSPDDEALFVGVSDRMIGSLMEFRRRRRHDYLESFV